MEKKKKVFFNSGYNTSYRSDFKISCKMQYFDVIDSYNYSTLFFLNLC